MTASGLVLVDMDGVLADWGSAYGAGLDRYGKRSAAIPRHEEQTTFDLFKDRTPEERAIIHEVMSRMDYFRLEPLPGAIKAVQSMQEWGHEVMICTSPWLPNPSCLADKVDWVREYLGEDWVDRIIITKDKTVVVGDILIDDKPCITGVASPEWTHVVFTQPYNVKVPGPRLNSWADWSNENLGGIWS